MAVFSVILQCTVCMQRKLLEEPIHESSYYYQAEVTASFDAHVWIGGTNQHALLQLHSSAESAFLPGYKQLSPDGNTLTQNNLVITCLPGMVKILFILVPVEDRETQHPAGDDLCLLQQLV